MAREDLLVGGRLERIGLAQLEPDRLNPRLPPARRRKPLPIDELYEFIDRSYDALSIARSITQHGYFEAEPLVAVPRAAAYDDDDEGPGEYVVVEGNRRLTALRGLTDPSLRKRLAKQRKGWSALDLDDLRIPEELPVLVVDTRAKAAPILGFRHITRADPWEPLPQAKYVADLIDEQGRDFDQVAALLGRPTSDVRSAYRNYWIYAQSQLDLKLPDADRIADNFGTFTRCMQNPGIRGHIAAPAPRDVHPDYYPVPEDRADELFELVTWLFGAPRDIPVADRTRPGQVLRDSRDITRLGRVLADKRAVVVLRESEDLETAFEVLHDPQESLLSALRRAAAAIDRAAEEGLETEALRELRSQISEQIDEFDEA